jgi:hypothetical protein
VKRSVLTIPTSGSALFGTCHLPQGASSGRAGFLFLNAGPAPRAGNSDLSAHLCDHLASLGFPSFRFDLPGLGDTPGELPDDVEVFWRDVQLGRNVESAADLARKLRVKFGLTDLVMGGMCAGAVTSVLAVDQAVDAITGLILLEPNFRVTPILRQSSDRRVARSPFSRIRASLGRGWISRQWLRRFTRPGPFVRRFGMLLPILLRILTLVAGRPREINWRVVWALRRALSRRLPVFLATARGVGEDHYCRCLLAEFPRGCGRSLTEVSVADTNHIMTRGQARHILAASISTWAHAFSGRVERLDRRGTLPAGAIPHDRLPASTHGARPHPVQATSPPAEAGPA